MGQVKIKVLNNYLVVTDVATGAQIFPPQPTKELRYILDREMVFLKGVRSNRQTNYTPQIGLPVGLTGTVELTAGATGSVDGISVGGVEIMSGAYGTAQLASVLANTFATATAQCTSVIAGDTITINGLIYTAVAGLKADATEFSVDTSDTATALDLALSIKYDNRPGTLGDVSATATGDTVTVTSDQLGTAGDAITISRTGTTITLSGPTFSGGVDADTITVNGLVYTAVAGVKADSTEFSIDTSDDAAAADLADSVNTDTRAGTLGDITATSLTDTVTFTQTISGAAGKATTLTSTAGGRITLSGATFLGAEQFDTDLATTATNVAANITAFTSVPNYSATAVGALITIKIESPGVAVDGLAVVSEVTTIASTDVNMGVDTGDIVDSAGTEFASLVLLEAFLSANTGA